MSKRKDVAELAGVSVATVSYVLNNTKKIRPEVRAKVLNAVEQLGYRPNILAQSLSTKRTRHIAMLVDNLLNPHYCEILDGVQSYAYEKGYLVSILSMEHAGTVNALDLSRRGIEGVIITLGAFTLDQSVYDELKRAKTIIQSHNIIIEFQNAYMDIVSTLKQLGHVDIAFLNGFGRYASYVHERFTSFKRAMEYHNLPINDDIIYYREEGDKTDELAGDIAMQNILDRKQKFTAVIALNDLMAIGAIKALSRAGLSVPGDISVVGCDNLQVFSYNEPTLATIDVQSFDIGRIFAADLIERINDRTYVHSENIVAKFIKKDSIGSVAK